MKDEKWKNKKEIKEKKTKSEKNKVTHIIKMCVANLPLFSWYLK